MINNNFPIQNQFINNDSTFNLGQFSQINIIDNNNKDGPLRLDTNTNLLAFDETQFNLDLGQINTSAFTNTPLVFCKKTNNIIPHQDHVDYDNQCLKISSDMFSQYTNINQNVQIGDNYVLVYLGGGVFQWQYIGDAQIELDPTKNGYILYNNNSDIGYLQYITNDLIQSITFSKISNPSFVLNMVQGLNTDGTNGQVLQTNGSGVLSWVNQTAPVVLPAYFCYNGLSKQYILNSDIQDNEINIIKLLKPTTNTTSDQFLIYSQTGNNQWYKPLSNGLLYYQNGNEITTTGVQNQRLILYDGGNLSFYSQTNKFVYYGASGNLEYNQYIINSNFQNNTISPNILSFPSNITRDRILYYDKTSNTIKYQDNQVQSSINYFDSNSIMQNLPFTARGLLYVDSLGIPTFQTFTASKIISTDASQNITQYSPGANCIIIYNSSGNLSNISGTNSLPFFNSSSQLAQLTNNNAFVIFNSASALSTIKPTVSAFIVTNNLGNPTWVSNSSQNCCTFPIFDSSNSVNRSANFSTTKAEVVQCTGSTFGPFSGIASTPSFIAYNSSGNLANVGGGTSNAVSLPFILNGTSLGLMSGTLIFNDFVSKQGYTDTQYYSGVYNNRTTNPISGGDLIGTTPLSMFLGQDNNGTGYFACNGNGCVIAGRGASQGGQLAIVQFVDEDTENTFKSWIRASDGSLVLSSDQNKKYSILKKNMNDNYLERLRKINVYTYAFNTIEIKETDSEEVKIQKQKKLKTINQGLLSQEIGKVFPHCVGSTRYIKNFVSQQDEEVFKQKSCCNDNIQFEDEQTTNPGIDQYQLLLYVIMSIQQLCNQKDQEIKELNYKIQQNQNEIQLLKEQLQLINLKLNLLIK